MKKLKELEVETTEKLWSLLNYTLLLGSFRLVRLLGHMIVGFTT